MKHTLAIVVLLGVFALFARRQIFTWPYYYDEADYMYVTSLGWRANYTGAPAQPLSDYIRVGLRRGEDPSERAALSEQIRRFLSPLARSALLLLAARVAPAPSGRARHAQPFLRVPRCYFSHHLLREPLAFSRHTGISGSDSCPGVLSLELSHHADQ
jgi:hypothetical protein